MSDLLVIGSSGLRAYQRALTAVSTNISNAANPNYVRRDLRLGELAISTSFDPYHNGQIKFGGVDITGLARAHDPFLEASARLTGASLYGAETQARWMSSVETALGDNDHGVGSHLNKFFATGEELAAAPFDSVLRSQFIADIDSTVSAINRTANDLALVSQQITGSAEQEVTTLNQALESLAETNIGLRGAADGSPKQAALLDQRDTALAVITERIDVEITFSDKKIANISYDGNALVTVGDTQSLSITSATDGTLSLSLGGTALSPPTQGSISALIFSAATNAQRRSELDDLANGLAGDINAWNASGRTDGGTAGSALLEAGSGAAGLSLLTQNITDLALAAPGGAANGNIIGLTALRGTGGTEQAWTNIVGSQAVITSAAQSETAAATAQHQAARQARDNLSSVDLDREAADLIRFQQAYDASARVIQVARETMQTIFAIF